MRRILVSSALLVPLALAAATAAGASSPTRAGYLVVRHSANDGGVNGRPLAAIVVKGFVLGRFSQEARVDVYQLRSPAGQGGVQVKGADVSSRAIRLSPSVTGREYVGNNFRLRALGGPYRVVVRGSGGVYLFVGGSGHFTLRGSRRYPTTDGTYSVNGGKFRSLPATPLKRTIGGGG